MAQIRDTLGFYGFNRDVFRNGRKQQTELSVNGGSDVFSYFASGNYLDDAGAEPNNYQRKASGRVNLGVAPSQNFRIAINAGAVAGPTYLSCEAGCGGRVWTLTATTPANCANKWTHCLYSSIPEAYDETYNFWQDMTGYRRACASITRPPPGSPIASPRASTALASRTCTTRRASTRCSPARRSATTRWAARTSRTAR